MNKLAQGQGADQVQRQEQFHAGRVHIVGARLLVTTQGVQSPIWTGYPLVGTNLLLATNYILEKSDIE